MASTRWGKNRRKLWLITDLYEGVAWKRERETNETKRYIGGGREKRVMVEWLSRFCFSRGSRPVHGAIIN